MSWIVKLALLASVEAMFQINFHTRVQGKWKDNLSKKFRAILIKDARVSFEHHIIATWEGVYPETRKYFQPVRKILDYRHWLAHGRYWLLKYRKFKFDELYEIAEALQNMLENENY